MILFIVILLQTILIVDSYYILVDRNFDSHVFFDNIIRHYHYNFSILIKLDTYMYSIEAISYYFLQYYHFIHINYYLIFGLNCLHCLHTVPITMIIQLVLYLYVIMVIV